MKRSLINYELLRRDIEDRKETPGRIAADSGLDRTIVAKLMHGGDSFRALSLEHFAKLVIWLGAPADRYILRPLRMVKADQEDE